MVQCSKYLQTRGHKFRSPTPMQKSGMVEHAYNPSAGVNANP